MLIRSCLESISRGECGPYHERRVLETYAEIYKCGLAVVQWITEKMKKCWRDVRVRNKA